MTTPPAESVLTLQELRNAAAQLERVALAAGGVTESELDARRPGAPEYSDDGPGAWLAYHGWIASRTGPAARADHGRAVAQVKLDAAIDAPVPVRLECGETVFVQPKSARALLYMRGLDAELRAIGPTVAALLDGDEPVPSAVHAAVWGAVLQSESLAFWIWTAIEGLDLPFDPAAGEAAAPPAITRQVRARDLLRLLEAHQQVNQGDLEILVRLFPTQGEDRPARDLADVLAAIAGERGVATATLFTSVSLRSLYHQALSSALVAEDAKRRAARADGRR